MNCGLEDSLVRELQGKRVLEIFSGIGVLAKVLLDAGIDITPTSIPRYSEEADADKVGAGVFRLDALSAVKELGSEHDVLLIVWPTVTNDVLKAANLWGKEKPIIFVGEVTDYSKKPPFLGGCATDEFFDAFKISRTLNYSPINKHDKAIIGTIS
jgi:hypothetical protein